MEFDKSRVFTSLNADELKVGDKVIGGCCLADLKYKEGVETVDVILDEGEEYRITTKEGCYYSLAYLVEKKENCTNCGRVWCEEQENQEHLKVECCNEWMKPKESKTEKVEKHYRPFANTNELIKVWCEKAKATPPILDMPYIWVRSKFNKDHKGCLITNFFGKYVLMNNQQCFLSRLFDEYTFLDGSVCGVEE